MTTLIVYGTVEGQTARIARFLADRITSAGHAAALFDTSQTADLSFDGIDRVFLAAPVHERRHPRDFEAFVTAHRDDLAARRSVMLSVGLKVAFEGGREEAEDYLREMEMRTRFTPNREVLVAGALRAGAYGYFETEVLRHVVLAGQDFRPEDGPHEFTDWDALAALVDEELA